MDGAPGVESRARRREMGCKRCADRLFEGGKVVFDGEPNGLIVEAIVGVSKDISHPPNLASVRSGT